MLKETEAEETTVFFVTFLSWVAFQLGGPQAVADPENFGGGGFEAQNLKNSDVFTKIESDFSAEIGNSNVFSQKKKKKKSLHQN